MHQDGVRCSSNRRQPLAGAGATPSVVTLRRTRLRHVMLGDGRLVRLTIAHGLAGAADAFVTVSLAGSLFFNVSPDASRRQVLLYLLITMAPLAVLAPLVGPTVDRFRRWQRFVASIFYLLACPLPVSPSSASCSTSPSTRLRWLLLIASKASGVVKQTLVQRLVDDPDELVATNARLARFASITAAIGVGMAAGLLAAAGRRVVAARRQCVVRNGGHSSSSGCRPRASRRADGRRRRVRRDAPADRGGVARSAAGDPRRRSASSSSRWRSRSARDQRACLLYGLAAGLPTGSARSRAHRRTVLRRGSARSN